MPVVVFTNAYVANMIHESLTAGASAVYNKSTVTPRQIIDVLATFLSPPAAVAPNVTMPAGAPSLGGGAAAETTSNRINGADDSQFQNELLRSFDRSSPAAVNEMRKLLQEISKSAEAQRPQFLEQLYQKTRSFSSNAGLAGIAFLAKMGSALEALIKEMIEKPKNITPSTLRTAAAAIDFFAELSRPGLRPDLADNPPIDILVVDDELLSRRAIIYALEKAFLKATPVEDGEAALAKAQMGKFDLIFLDVNMPGMNGFQLCEHLRQTNRNKTTPVVFVTSTADFQAKAQTTLRGGSDLIAKPFLFIELTVKALTFALRHRIETEKQNRPAQVSASAAPTPEAAELFL
jgi:CheY-like chemotaxis protein